MLLASGGLAKRCTPSSLRFPEAQMEGELLAYLESQMTSPMIVCSSFMLLMLLNAGFEIVALWGTLEGRPADGPEWAHAHYEASACAVNFAVFATALALGLLRRCKIFTCPGWESINVFFLGWFQVAMPFSSNTTTLRMAGLETYFHEADRRDFYVLMTMIAGVGVGCLYFPVRTFKMWVVPVVGCLTILVLWLNGLCLNAGQSWQCVLVFSFTLFIFYKGARRNERQFRREWLAQSMLKKQATELTSSASVAAAFHAVAGTWCEVVMLLSSDLKVVRADASVDVFFGQAMQGQLFSDVVHEKDQQRFTRTLEAASTSKVLQSVPVCLHGAACKAQAQVVVVDSGVSMPRYILGIHSVEQQMTSTTSTPGHADVERPTNSRGDHDEAASSAHGPLASVASTTATGRMFADLLRLSGDTDEQHASAVAQVEGIVDMGRREHWLLEPHDLKLIPRRVLGEGGFGVVVMATLGGTPAAAKLPKGGPMARNFKHFEVLANELRVHRQIRHPNIVAFLGAILDVADLDACLVFELVDGRPLHQYVRSFISDGAALKVGLDTAGALRYLHELQPPIVHSDLKPQNILVETNSSDVLPKSKLADLGLARVVTQGSKLIGGTKRWMAPELRVAAEIRPKPRPSSDVFSFGLLLAFLARHTGTKGASPEQPAAATSAAREGQGLLQQLVALIKASTQAEPAGRPDMALVQTELLSLLPTDPEALILFGRGILSLTVPSASWEEGRQKLRGAAAETVPEVDPPDLHRIQAL